MKRACLLVVLLVASATTLNVKARTVKLLKINELEGRLTAGKDTTYIINFWATWCAPCVAELPHFERLAQTYKKEPMKVLLVSLDFRSKLETAVRPFVEKNHLQNEVFLLNESNQQEYIEKISKEWSGSIPATLVVNKKKNIKLFKEQEFSYEELEKLYKSLKP